MNTSNAATFCWRPAFTARVTAGLAMLLPWLSASANAMPTFPPGGFVEEYASGVGAADGLGFGPDGRLYVTDYGGGRLLRFPLNYVPGSNLYDTLVSGIPNLVNVAVGSNGGAYVAAGNGFVYHVGDDGQVLPFVHGFAAPAALEAWNTNLYVANSGDGTVAHIDQQGAVTPFLSGFSAPNGPYGVSIDPSGAIHFCDHASGAVYAADLAGNVTPLAAVTPLGATFTLAAPEGGVYVGDAVAAVVWIVDTNGAVTLFASGFAGQQSAPAIGPTGIALDAAGRLYVGDGDRVWRYSPDADADGVTDALDNCTLVSNPDQRDSNGDGYGNLCDADLNDDGIVNFADLGALKSVFFSADPDADLDGNGIVNFLDLGLMEQGFFQPPGPSGVGVNSCSTT